MSSPDRTLDIRGKICPFTLIETRNTLKELTSGQRLEVLVDHEPAAAETIPNFCTKKGYPLETTLDPDGFWRLFIERTD